MIVEYYKKNVYGKSNIYIADAVIAEKMQKITSKKTINKSDIDAFESLGFKFVEVLPR